MIDAELKQKLLDYIAELETLHPYKVQGDYESYSQYNEGWTDALYRVEEFITGMYGHD